MNQTAITSASTTTSLLSGHRLMGVAAFVVAVIANIVISAVLLLIFSAIKDYLPAVYAPKQKKFNNARYVAVYPSFVARWLPF